MQVFVPSTDLAECAQVLSRPHLGKQRVEVYQIVLSLLSIAPETSIVRDENGAIRADKRGRPIQEWTGSFIPRPNTAWRNHPATRAWQNNLNGLLMYQTAICVEWTNRGYADTCLKKTAAAIDFAGLIDYPYLPTWWGDEKVHASHRAALLFKNFEWYSQWGWDELPAYQYVWPVSQEV